MFLRLWTRAPRIDRKSSTTIESISALKHKPFRKRLLTWFDDNAREASLAGAAGSVPHLDLGSHAAADACRGRDAVLRALPRTIPDDCEAWRRRRNTICCKAWAGLGYYSRARNLQKAAIQIQRLDVFPSDYGAIRSLPGVGDYTAAAIASIAFGLPYAAVDGNVVRVITRLENAEVDVQAEAQARLDRNAIRATSIKR